VPIFINQLERSVIKVNMHGRESIRKKIKMRNHSIADSVFFFWSTLQELELVDSAKDSWFSRVRPYDFVKKYMKAQT